MGADVGAEILEQTPIEAADAFSDAFAEATIDVKPEDKSAAAAELSVIEQPENVEPPPEIIPEASPAVEPDWAAKEREYQERIKVLEESHVTPEVSEVPSPIPVTPVEPLASLSEDEKQALEVYEQEYEEVAKYEGIKRKAEMAAMTEAFEKKLQSMITAMSEAMAPALKVAADYAREKHFKEIEEKHEDFSDIRDKGLLKNWIAGRPDEIRKHYQEWYDKGNSKQIITLLDLYKESNGGIKPSKPQRTTPSVVLTKKGPVTPTHIAAKDDFEGAFEEAIRKIG